MAAKYCILILSLFVSLSVSAFEARTPPPAMPLPWPFPWAKECPVKWESLAGRYWLTKPGNFGQVSDQYIDLDVSVLFKGKYRLIQVDRYNENGIRVSSGFTIVTDKKRSFRMRLIPDDTSKPVLIAMIKFHYLSEIHQCTSDKLVPILSLISDTPAQDEVQYKLIREDDKL